MKIIIILIGFSMLLGCYEPEREVVESSLFIHHPRHSHPKYRHTARKCLYKYDSHDSFKNELVYKLIWSPYRGRGRLQECRKYLYKKHH